MGLKGIVVLSFEVEEEMFWFLARVRRAEAIGVVFFRSKRCW
jgi:hypothetical protein